MKYLNKSFTVNPADSAAYRDNYDRVFGRKDPLPPAPVAVNELYVQARTSYHANRLRRGGGDDVLITREDGTLVIVSGVDLLRFLKP